MTDNLILGMDSSVWDDIAETSYVPDFQKAYDQGMRFNYIKASQNVYADSNYKRDRANCRKTPLLIGSYHFMTWDNPIKQAEFFWETIKDDPGELPVVDDWEWWSTVPPNAYDILYNFLERFKTISGKKSSDIMIYTAKSFFDQYSNGADSYWGSYKLWLAHYNTTYPTLAEMPKPWTDCFLWQYTSNGDGLKYGMESKSLDMNYMKIEYFNQYSKTPVVIDPIPIPVPIEDGCDMLKMKVIVDTLNVRSLPSTNGASLYKLKKGDVVSVYNVAGAFGGAWVQISPTDAKWCCVQDNNRTYLQKVVE